MLVDTGEFHFQSWNETFEELDVPFDREDFRKTFGMNNAGILERILERKPEPDEVTRISDKKEYLFRELVKGKAKFHLFFFEFHQHEIDVKPLLMQTLTYHT